MIQSNSLSKTSRRLNFTLHSLIAREPSLWLLYQPYIIWGQIKKKAKGIDPQESSVGSHTELVIDGFQGSANSFATVAFKNSQTKDVLIAHHLHSPSQIIKAVENKIPVLLTVREPVGAILSLTARWNYISITQALKSYIGFYSKLIPYAEDCVVSTFKQTTQNLDEVIREINVRFNTKFDLIDLNKVEESRKEVLENAEERALRKRIKAQKKQEFELPKNAALLQKARAIHQQFVSIASKKHQQPSEN